MGSLLFSEVTGGLRGRGVAAAETFARRGSPDNPSGPAEIYLIHGFRVMREDPEFHLLRLELA